MRIIDKLLEAIIIFLIVFSPFAFGSVHLWAYTIEEILIEIAFFLWILKIILKKEDFVEIELPFPKINAFFLFFILIILLQLIPLPHPVLCFLSPNTCKLYKMTLSEDLRTISICRSRTVEESFKFIFYFLTFFLSLHIFSSRRSIKRAMTVILITGAAEALLGIFQLLTKTEKIFWFWQSHYKKGGYFGSFVNPNHFAAYMEIAVCVSVGFLLSRRRIPFYPSQESWRHYLYKYEPYLAKNVLITFLISIMGVALFLSLSRGGILCFIFSFILIFMLQGIKLFKRKTLVILASLSLALTIWIGIDPILKELSTIFKRGSPLRIAVWKDSMKILKDYPILGVGLGNFQNIYPIYRTLKTGGFFDHAHNEYLELMIDTGIAGFFAFFIPVLLCIHVCIKKWIKRKERFSVGITLGGLAAICSILMHSLAEFNFHIPAISFLFFLTMGLILRSVYLYYPVPEKKIKIKKEKFLFISAFIFILLVALVSKQISMFKAEVMFNKYLRTKDVTYLKKAVDLNPGKGKYLYALIQEYIPDIEKHKKEVITLCLNTIKINPTNPFYHLTAAWVGLRLNEPSVFPELHISVAERLDPTNPYVKKVVRLLRKWEASLR